MVVFVYNLILETLIISLIFFKVFFLHIHDFGCYISMIYVLYDVYIMYIMKVCAHLSIEVHLCLSIRDLALLAPSCT